jgi:non-heme chloroperoxidase
VAAGNWSTNAALQQALGGSLPAKIPMRFQFACIGNYFKDQQESQMSVYKNSGQYIEVDSGVEIYYEDRGEGSPVIFLPGWTFTTEVYEHQMQHFSKTNRAIVVDPRSHGRSTITNYGNNYATHGADLAQIIKALNLRDVILVGWSFGCLALWEYIRQEGVGNVKAAICVDLSPKPLSVNVDDWVEGPLDEIAGAYNAYLQSPKGQRDFVAYYATEVMVQRDLEEDELFWIIEQSLKTPYFIASSLFASGMFSDYMAEAKLMDESIPTLSIIAEHWAETAVAFTDKHFPNTQSAVLGGHLMFWEHSDKFNKLIDDFISSI